MKGQVLITGIAGFIGFYVARRFLQEGYTVIGIDNLNDYYDVNLKKERLRLLGLEKSLFEREGAFGSCETKERLLFYYQDICDEKFLREIFSEHNIVCVLHFAAQAGVRYSIENPEAYFRSNLLGFFNIIERCRAIDVPLIFASSSSVYGESNEIPFKENHSVEHPISFYAATKASNELMAHSYAKIYGLKSVALRFFTVYGPLGRPDMAPMLFLDAAFSGKTIRVFNHGQQMRDFTFIDDIVESIWRLFQRKSELKTESVKFNIGNGDPVMLMDFIDAIENSAGKNLDKEFVDAQKGDVTRTFADSSSLFAFTDFRPNTHLQRGVADLVEWYQSFYNISSSQ